ncbi:class I SAM-dependent methyltransferase [Gammaproteobacteria bacterium]|nr:class I SAM-dependent methyltransferase [Gammaproteobacteria bacterium]
MKLSKFYFLIIRFGILRAIYFLLHFYILNIQIKKILGKKLEKYKLLNPGKLPEKYLDYSFWIFENLLRVFDLELYRKKDLKILDIGCGPGYFIYIANYFGNYAKGLDLPSNEIYNLLVKELSLYRDIKEIKKSESLNLEENKSFDLITAFMVCFDGHGTNQSWKKIDWMFFIDDIQKNYLKANGRIVLGLNPDPDINNRTEVELYLKPWLYNG